MDDQVECLKAIEEMMRAYAEHVSMDMATFPMLLAVPTLADNDDATTKEDDD